MGITKKLKNGRYKVTVYDNAGIRHRKTFNKKVEADAYIGKLEAQKHEAQLVANKLKKPHYDIITEIDNWLAMKQDRRPKTIQKYNNFVKQFKLFCQAIGISHVDEFSSDHAIILLKELTKEKRDPKGSTDRILKPMPRTVNYYLARTRAFFEYEIRNNHITRNPMCVVNNVRIDKKPPEFYSAEEIRSFFKQEIQTVYRNAFLVLLHTGMRFGELANLTWNDIDTENKLIHIRPKENFRTKTYRSIRSIPMNEVLIKLFEAIKVSPISDTYPICSPEGKQIRERKLYYICRKIGLKAGIKGIISLHKWRHTFASQLVQNNVRIEIIKELLGHSSIKETLIYAHLRPENLHSDVAVLNNIFGKL